MSYSMQRPEIIQKPTVAIVGRTNVGKSTLFNRLIEESKALVSPIAGTTRAPNYGEVLWRGRIFQVVDTGGLERRSQDPFAEDISRQAARAAEKATVILFLVDVRAGLTPHDRTLAKQLRVIKNRVILVGNKAERKEDRNQTGGAWNGLGLGPLRTISAVTGVGVGDLLDHTFDQLKTQNQEPPTVEEALAPIKVAIIGKPNVGKSSLLNKLVGAERALVSEIAHTTREPQDTLVRLGEDFFLFIDTAGVRKKMKIADNLESAGVRKTLAALERADIVLFVTDLVTGIGLQDKHLAGLATEAGKGVIIVANKWDLVIEKTPNSPERAREELAYRLPFMTWAPVEFISAKTGLHVSKIYELAKQVRANWGRTEIPEKTLDKFLKRMVKIHRPSGGKGVRHPYIYHLKQVGTRPPTFLISIRGGRDSVHASYLRFLENKLREHFDLFGTPVRVLAQTIRPKV